MSKTRVLLCDDTRDIRVLIALELSFHDDIEVVGEAGNGREAIDLAAATQPHVVILDLAMPVMDGLEALPAIRRVSPSSQVVVLSGFDAGAMAHQAMARGAARYLEKGTEPREITRVIREVAGTHRSNGSHAGSAQADPPDLLALAVHELAQPLAAAMGFARILRDKHERLSDQDRMLGVRAIARNLEQLEHLLRTLGTLHTLDEGGLIVSPEEVDIEVFVKEAIEDFTGGRSDREILWRCDAAAIVSIDPVRFRQVLVNLLGNADKFAPAGTPIGVACSFDDGFVRIAIHNEGPGFSEQDAQRIFERSVRLDPTTAGLGLGLYVARAIVEAHGGKIGASSGPGAGATFYVCLPQARS